MTLGQPAGTVDFSVASEPGKTTVTMTAAEGADIYWTADAEGAGEQWAKYAAPVEFTKAASIRAYAMEGKKKGAVSSMYVMVLDRQQPDEPSTPVEPGDEAKRSGAVEFSWVADTDGVPVVTITPADKSITAYSIYYTVDSRKQLAETPECLYTGSFRLEEGGIVMAMLVEQGKKAGQVQEVHIWYVPTSTGDTSADSATADDAVTAEGDTILAPAGSEAYDLTGRRVAMSGLRAGVYIVRLPGGKAVKVSVR